MFKKLDRRRLILYSIFFCLILLIQLPWYLRSDDAVAHEPGLSVLGFAVSRFFSNGRYFTDAIAYFFQDHMPLWKIVNAGLYVVFAKLVVYLLDRKNFLIDILCCLLLLLFPFEYWDSAGYIATSTNYLYPTICVLAVAVILKRVGKVERLPVWQIPLLFVLCFYATSQDQAGVAAIMLLFFLFIYLKWFHKKMSALWWKTFWLTTFFTCSGFLFYFFSPGHLNRMHSTASMEHWLPQYANWTLAQKLYHGYSSSVATLIYQDQPYLLILVLLLAILAYQKKRYLAMVPLGFLLVVRIWGYHHFSILYADMHGVAELGPLYEPTSWVALILSFVFLLWIVVSLFRLVDDRQHLFTLYALLLVAAATREMMGLSPTIYASSQRTFVFALFCLLLCDLILIRESTNQMDVPTHGYMLYLGLLAGMVLMRFPQ